MTFSDQARTAFSNVGRRKLRSTLASLGVVVGTLTIVIMVSLAVGVRQQINHQFALIGLDRLTVNPPGSRRGGFSPFSLFMPKKIISPDDISEWKGTPGVVQVIPEVNLPSSVGLALAWKGTNLPVRMSNPDARGDMFFQGPPQPIAGTLDLPESGGAVLSLGIAEAARIPTNDLTRMLGQTVQVILRTSRGETQNYALRVQGFSQERVPVMDVSVADRFAMKSWWFNSTNTLASEGYDSVTIRTTDVSRARALAAQIRADGFSVQSLEIVVEVADRIVTVIAMMFTMIGSVALLVAAIGIANTMVMAIYERTREIGILKAMGASRREIRQMFMIEAGFIGMIGGVTGLLLGWLLGLGLNQVINFILKRRDLPLHGDFFVVTLPLAAAAIIFATLIGLVAGLLPAHRAAKLDPLEALRHE